MPDIPHENSETGLEIAIIGMTGRFPGARDLNEFWDNLKDGMEGISVFTDEELEKAGVDSEKLKHPGFIKAKGLLEDFDRFDAAFFGYIPGEVVLMDPQIRVFHECAWAALEDAGYVPDNYNGLIGVYAGASAHLNWEALSLLSGRDKALGRFNAWQLFDKDFLCTRISYNLNLRGPSFNMQTACSTSLVAVHLACQGLLAGECDMALAGGVSVRTPNKDGYIYQEGMVMSPDGHCRAFDAKAAGTVPGEGCGIVVLKQLEHALEDRDYIHAVIKGSAINNDGKFKVGYTAPSIKGQVGVIRAAHRAAEVTPDSIRYVEAHGTGTVLGDPAEIEALKQVFGSDKKGACAIGSVKSNIGHLDTAAGAAGFIKTVLALKYRLIPPSLHFEKPNPKIDFAGSPFYVNQCLSPWPDSPPPLRAGVSSFGIGGTNAHVVLEEAPEVPRDKGNLPLRNRQLIVLSANTEASVDRAARRLADHFKTNPGISLADAAYTLQVGRKVFKHRRMAVCSTLEEAVETLLTPDSEMLSTYSDDDGRSVVFMFPGQGAQYGDMTRDIYRTEPYFRKEMDHCFKILEPLTGCDPKEILYPPNRSDRTYKAYSQALNRTEFTQPFLFTVEYSLAKLLIKWGITPYAMIGHSIGEYTAACLAGVFSLEDALTVVALRGKLMQRMSTGAMIGVHLSPQELDPLLKEANGKISAAAVNTPNRCVVSGPHEAIDVFEKRLARGNIQGSRLHTSHAFHSPMMDPILAEFEAALKQVTLKEPTLPYISNLTGGWIKEGEATSPGYWASHLRNTVYFSKGVECLLEGRDIIFVEVGPGKTLSTFVRQHPRIKPKQVLIDLVRHPKKTAADDRYLLDKIGQLWLYGVCPDWEAFYTDQKRRRVSLPTYSFEPRRFPVDGSPFKMLAVRAAEKPDLEKKTNIADWFYIPTWTRTILPPPPGGGTGPTPRKKDPWMVFVDSNAWGDKLVGALEAGGRDVTRVTAVTAGSEFRRIKKGHYNLDPGNPGHYTALLEELRDREQSPKTIVHLWGITPVNQSPLTPEKVEKTQDTGFYSILHLVRAVGAQDMNRKLHLAVVTNNMYDVTGEEPLCPEKATLPGALKVIPLEYPGISCRGIDILLPGEGSPQEQRLIALLQAELELESTGEGADPAPVVAFRHNRRWRQEFKPLRLNALNGKTRLLKEKGVYLITGGLGGVGLVTAEHLARKVQARLILIGRSEFPPAHRWEEWLSSHEPKDPKSRKIARLQALRAWGAEVLTVRADAADLRQMQAAISLAHRTFGPIHGVIHCAGAADYAGVIQRRTQEATGAVLAAKVYGTVTIDNLLREQQPLDFFISYSSLSSVLGAFGQVGYCAANAFLDAYAQYKNAAGPTPYISINWDTWQEVGMAVEAVKKLTGTRDVEHPLFRFCTVEKNRVVYVTHFSEENHWVMKEHRLAGKPTLPGTGCLELARAAYEDHFGEEIMDIRDVFFFTPLMLDENEERETLTILEKKEQGCDFHIISQPGSRQEQWILHARGSIAPIGQEDREPGNRDIGELRQRCNRSYDRLSEDIRQVELMKFGPRWSSMKEKRFGINEGLAVMQLHHTFTHDITVDRYKLHPALLDVAVGFMGIKFQDPYLPFSYKQVKVYRPLSPTLYCHSRFLRDPDSRKETVKFDMTLMDKQGVVSVEIREYTLLMVSDEARARIEKRLDISGGQNAVFDSPSQFHKEFLENYILSSEGVEALERVLEAAQPQVIISTRDLPLRMEQGHASRVANLLEELDSGRSEHFGPVSPRPDLSTPYTAPTNEVEQKLAIIWQNFLGIEKVGINDDFFELGGDSLKAVTFLARIHKELNARVPIAELFNSSTVKTLSRYIAGTRKEAYLEIREAEKREYYPQSAAQRRLFFLDRFADAAASYNLPVAFSIKGKLDKERLGKAFQYLVNRHEAFRTSFHLINGEPVQQVSPGDESPFAVREICARQKEIPGIIKEFIRPYDLGSPPLLRVALVPLSTDGHLLLFDMHHIIGDGKSIDILRDEFIKLYTGVTLSPLRIQYKDFSCWQNNLSGTGSFKKQENFWLTLYSDLQEHPGLNLPTDYDRPAIQSFEGNVVRAVINPDDTRALRELALEAKATMYIVILAIYNILLSKLSGQDDILVGTDVAGRNHADLEGCIGMFVNTLCLRNFSREDKTFTVFLDDVQKRTLESFENQDYQFDDLVRNLSVKRDMSRNPLFDVMYAFWNEGFMANLADMSLTDIAGLELQPYDFEYPTSQFDLTLTVVEEKERLLLSFEYCTKLFKEETIERFANYLKNIASAVKKKPGKPISQIEIISGEEKDRILYEFNNSCEEYRQDKTVHQLFEERAEQTPDFIAVYYEAIQLTYRELDRRSKGLAGVLREKGIEAGHIVGITIGPSLEMIAGMIAVLKSGGAYLPIGTDYPDARKRYVIEDSRLGILLTGGKTGYISGHVEAIDITEPGLYNGSSRGQPPPVKMSDLAYVIYTSGSTGSAKGVMIEHASFLNVIQWFNHRYELHPQSRVLQMTDITFDVSVEEIFTALTTSAALCIPEKYTIMDKQALLLYIKRHDITIAQFVPITLREFLSGIEKEAIPDLEVVICGGDVLDDSLKNTILEKGYHLYNHYGPTEGTVDATAAPCDDAGVVIGKPIANVETYIVNRQDRLQPVGVPGELLLGGTGVARGYLNQPELNEEKFIHDTFGRGGRGYRTGDLARWGHDGNIEFLGRLDSQVKIRGFRIELGEIEIQLRAIGGIDEAYVLDREKRGGEKYLCAYYVTGDSLKPSQIRQILSKQLPVYMIPSHFIRMETVPLTPSGKPDKRAMLNLEIDTSKDYIAPKSKTEKKIAAIWRDVLGLDKVGINENFFELGGNSIDVLRLNTRVKEFLSNEIPIITIFQYPTISALADYMDSETGDNEFTGDNRNEALRRGKRDRMRRLHKKIRR